MSDFPFAGRVGGTVTVAASTTSADETITAGCHWLRVVNTTDGVAFVKTGSTAAVTATSANFPVPAGGVAIMKMPSDHVTVGVILASGATSGNVYVTPVCW